MKARWTGSLQLMVFGACLLCIGCSSETSDLVKEVYPERQIFKMQSSFDETVFSYACVPGASPADTKARADKAHALVDQAFERFAQDSAARMVSAIEAERFSNAVLRQEEQRAEVMAASLLETSEQRFQCLPFDFEDT